MVGIPIDQSLLALALPPSPGSALPPGDLLHHLGLHHGHVHHALVEQARVSLKTQCQELRKGTVILTRVAFRRGLPGGLNLAIEGELFQLSSYS